MLPLDAESGTKKAQTSSAPFVSGHLSDTDSAHAMVHAMRAIPGVLHMGQGLFATDVTYGPGKHVAGIVFQHPAPGERAVEVHVVLDERFLNTALSDVCSSSETTPILLRCTEQVRAAVSQTLEQLGVPVPLTVDVTIDDIR
jgi:hypothetical protein